MAPHLGKPGGPGQFPTHDLSTVRGALESGQTGKGSICPLCAKSGLTRYSKDAGVARFIRTAELRQRQSVIDTNSGRSAHVHTAVAEPSHATWDLLGFGSWCVCAG